MSIDKETRLQYTQSAVEIVSKMTLDEKIGLMSGNSDISRSLELWRQSQSYSVYPYTTAGAEKYGVPPIVFCDGPKGVVCGLHKSTCFPAPIGRGASFDAALEEKIGAAIGREAQAYGANLFGGVCVNLPYHPGWGRNQEVYGEDSFTIGKMASMLVRGVQGENVMACVKHFAFNSMENSRFSVDVSCDKRTEREVFLPHFKDCIDAGAACVMGAYNSYQGEPACESSYLLRTVLKGEWDFDGFVLSDWFWGIKETAAAANAGIDLEMPVAKHYGKLLREQVLEGNVSEDRIDEAAVRIVRTVLAFDAARQQKGASYGDEILGCEAHTHLALQSARESITLLKNDGKVLPFWKSGMERITVIGSLATRDNLGDHGSSRVFPQHTVTPLEGLCNLLPNAEVIYYSGDDITHAKDLALESDAVVFVVGCSYEDEGEYSNTTCGIDFKTSIGGDRASLALHPHDIELLQSVGPQNRNTAVVLIGGGTILLDPWLDSVPSVLMAYYPGQEGGTAIAEVLFGVVNPSGKLPFVIPCLQEDLPDICWNTDHQRYGYYHGYAKLEKESVAPRLPYGFGLSYTEFVLSDASFRTDDQEIAVSCKVKNVGNRSGAEVVQLYVGFDHSKVDRPHKLLRAFERVELKSGEEKTVRLCCPVTTLAYYDEAAKKFVVEHMEYQLYIGTSSDEADLLKGTVSLR